MQLKFLARPLLLSILTCLVYFFAIFNFKLIFYYFRVLATLAFSFKQVFGYFLLFRYYLDSFTI